MTTPEERAMKIVEEMNAETSLLAQSSAPSIDAIQILLMGKIEKALCDHGDEKLEAACAAVSKVGGSVAYGSVKAAIRSQKDERIGHRDGWDAGATFGSGEMFNKEN